MIRAGLTRLKSRRDWDIPGGRIKVGETPAQAAIRETLEEASTRVKLLELVGIQELEIFGPRPESNRWGYPLSVQVFFRCEIEELLPFMANLETLSGASFRQKMPGECQPW